MLNNGIDPSSAHQSSNGALKCSFCNEEGHKSMNCDKIPTQIRSAHIARGHVIGKPFFGMPIGTDLREAHNNDKRKENRKKISLMKPLKSIQTPAMLLDKSFMQKRKS